MLPLGQSFQNDSRSATYLDRSTIVFVACETYSDSFLENLATESRRLAIHEALFGTFANLNHSMKRTKVENSNEFRREKDSKAPAVYPKILPTLVRPTHRLDHHGKAFKTYLKRRLAMMRAMDFEYNFAAETISMRLFSELYAYRSEKAIKRRTQINANNMQRIVDIVRSKLDRPPEIARKTQLKRRRNQFLHRFDRSDRAKLIKIANDPDLSLTQTQREEVDEIFGVGSPIETQEMAVQRTLLRRKRRRYKAGVLWAQANDYLRDQVGIFRQNQTRAYGLSPLTHTSEQPDAEITGNTVSAVDMEEIAKQEMVTLTVHTTGDPDNAAHDVIVVNEMHRKEFQPKLLPDDQHIRKKLMQAKLIG